MTRPEFDQYSECYEDLLKDPIRSRFSGNDSRFFHERKRDLIRSYFSQLNIDTRKLSYLDIGCGKGELLTLFQDDFGRRAGCDVSSGMLASVMGIETRVQQSSSMIPYGSAEFDFVTAVCVYHHVSPSERKALTAEVYRVLRPNGIFAIIEHNPLNPVTKKIVSRTPVDADAILLTPAESRKLMNDAGFSAVSLSYFLYFPESIYRRVGRIEHLLRKVPFGGQYGVFGAKNGSRVTMS